MNYREFTERVYNYKHGLTNSAESQNIQHSSKEENNVLGENNNPEDNIMHSKLGDEWDQHKYIRKEYLGNNNWRYIYADGSSNVTNAANETQADEAESRSRATQIRSTNKSNYQAEQARKNAGTVGGNSPASNTVPTPSQQAEEERRRAGTYNPASGIGQHLSSNVQSPSNQSFIEARGAAYQENQRIDASAHNPSAAPSIKAREGEDLPWQKIQGTKAESERKMAANHTTDGAKSLNLAIQQTTDRVKEAERKAALDQQQEFGAQNALQAAVNGLTSTGASEPNSLHRAMTETAIRNNGAPQGTPYTDLQNQSVDTTKELSAQKALTDYQEQLRDIYYDLNQAGFDDATIINFIRSSENRFGGESIMDQLNAFDPEKQQIIFFPGAEEGIRNYMNTVIPQLKNSAANLIDAKKTEDIKAKLTPEEYEYITKKQLTI